METIFLVIFTFLIFQRFGLSIITTSSNVTCIYRERQALVAFKQSLVDEYNRLSTWSGVECCEWRGVGCDTRSGHVVKLDLGLQVPLNDMEIFYYKELQGELSPSLQNLKHLRYLDLSMNGFSGNIPEFLGSFERLEYLNLSVSGLGGVVPHHLGNLSRLQYLDLRKCFPTRGCFGESKLDDMGWVSSLSSLRYLDLSGMTIGKDIDWFHPVNMLPSLLTLNLAWSDIINIPSVEFVNFTSLNSLDLSWNGLNSTIPVWLSNLTDLTHLNLENNHFHGKIPDFLGTFGALASIDLSLNSFDTSMPDLLCNLSSLVHLDLSRNMFSGPIPTSLGLLLKLEDLYLQENHLSGNIPISLGQLSKLKNLDLSHNSLVGVLSETHFTKLHNLGYMVLSSNSLALHFSSQWVAPFQLQILLASSCNVGPYFPNWLQTQTNLQRLHLSNSSIKDAIPNWFENILSHTFDLDLSDNLLSGHVPQTNGTSLKIVNLSKNRFTGSIPVHLCKVPSIQVLDLSQNTFSETLPACLGNLTNLGVMDLSNNNISGVLPSSLGSLEDLFSLHLHNNRLEGDIPASLQNLTGLTSMDLGNNLLTGTIPFWIGEKLSNLRFLNLQSNKFTGKIPLQLCQLSALQILSLAHNNITGTIPRCFGNLSGMVITSFPDDNSYYYMSNYYEENIMSSMKGRQLLFTKTIKYLTSLDLSSNNIVGEIPDTIMNLVELSNLNLSRNLLKGPIPINIGNLSQLESLDLSINKLSGRIPQGLTSLNFLSYLNLSFNNLSGPIPIGNQLQTLDDRSIYEGNSGLCGPPVLRSCKRNDASYNHDVGEDEGQDDTEGVWLYVGMGTGFPVGFMGLLGSLHFMRRWRVVYFETIENVCSWLTVSVAVNLACLRKKVFK